MLERARIRCPICRSSMPAVVVWAAGDRCPRCSTALTLPRRSEPRTDARSRGGVAVAPAGRAPTMDMPVAAPGRSDLVVLRWAQAFNARDLEGMLACVAERVELHPLRLRGLATQYRGRDGVRDWFATLRQTHQEYRITVCHLRDLGAGKVFASGSLSLDDEPDVGPICILHELDAGMIVRAREYLSDPDTIERLGLIP